MEEDASGAGVTVPVFHGRVEGGKLELRPEEAETRRRHLESLEGRSVDVFVRKHQDKRSLDQNAWLWGVAYPLLADCLGYDQHEHDMLHYACLGECYGTTYDQRFGRELPRVKSSKMTTKEFSDYMEWLVRWAATTHDCVIPLPGETD